MDVWIVDNEDELAETAAGLVTGLVQHRHDAVLGLATGSTPLGLYRRLVERHRDGALDCSGLTTFNLDEYVGLAPGHEQSYRYYMDNNLFRYVNIRRERTHVPDGCAPDLQAHARQYEQMIASADGIDLQVLGIGRDGHIGFNEPGGSLCSRTRTVVLTEETIEDNARFFNSPDEVPRLAVSMGLGTIMEAGRCLLLASGDGKAEAVRGCVEGPLCAMTPASVLQMHPDTTVIVDRAAASRLQRRSYYEWCMKQQTAEV